MTARERLRSLADRLDRDPCLLDADKEAAALRALAARIDASSEQVTRELAGRRGICEVAYLAGMGDMIANLDADLDAPSGRVMPGKETT